MTPWDPPQDPAYLLGWNESRYHPPTDSAAAATAMVSGVKTYNGLVNIAPTGEQLQTVAHDLQRRRNFSIGLVTDVPISHATPAAMYAHNVSRLDYQDLTRDLLGQVSSAHREHALPGVDVLLGAGWGALSPSDKHQGGDFVAGNQYLADEDLRRADAAAGGRYVVVQRTPGCNGAKLLDEAAQKATRERRRLLGIFGTRSGGLPYRTADGDYHPVAGVTPAEPYSPADLTENPTLAEMTRAALRVLSTNPNGFWLMVEAGQVDLACHDANIDNAIGAVLAGDEAFAEITAWIEANEAWRETAVIVTSDHGHGFVLTDPNVFTGASSVGR